MQSSKSMEQPFVEIHESSRLRYKTLQMSDLPAVRSIISQKQTMQWTSRSAITSQEEAEAWLRDRAVGQHIYNFAVLLKQEPNAAEQDVMYDQVIGLMGIIRHPEIGYMFHPDLPAGTDWFGKGYATEALQSMLPRFRDKIHSATDASGTPYTYVEAQTDSENLASRKLLEKCGFCLDELRLKDFVNPTLGVRDTAVYRYHK